MQIDDLRLTLLQCLERLDVLGFNHTAAHLDMAIHQLDKDAARHPPSLAEMEASALD